MTWIESPQKVTRDQVTMRVIDFNVAKNVVVKNHYSHSMPVTNLSLGFYMDGKLACVVVFGQSATSRMAHSLPSPKYRELVRLFAYDWAGKNIESICISMALNYLEKNCDIDVVISFADPSHGHAGCIYQATNWLYCGLTDKAGNKIYSVDGQKLHPRTLLKRYGISSGGNLLELLQRDNPGSEITVGTHTRKHRYIYLLGNRKRRKELRKNLKYEIMPYPKLNASEAGEVSRVTRTTTSSEGLVRFQQPASGALNWVEPLQKANFPDTVLLLDFETYFDQDYHLGSDKKALSTIEYITDDRFEFTGLGIQVFNHPLANHGPMFIEGPMVERAVRGLKKHFGIGYHNCTVVAKNCRFDITILTHHFGIYPPYTVDIEDLTRYYDSRMSQKLKDVAALFKLKAKGDTKQFKGLHWQDMDAGIRRALKEYTIGDIEIEATLLQKFLPMIADPKFELDLARHTLNLYLKPELVLDFNKATMLVCDMETEVDKIIESVKGYWPPDTKESYIKKILRGRKEFPKMLGRALGDDPLPMKKGTKEMIPALAKTDEACQHLLGHKNKKIRDLVSARLGITSWPSHAKRVNRLIKQSQCSGDKTRVPLKYHGCHTGRWSGCEGINLQNLGGKGRGEPIHPLIAAIRGCLVAPEGYTLAIVDSAQIEARELAWLSGQNDLVEGFANGEDIYSKFATRLFGERVWKPESSDDSPEAKIASIRRGFGKDTILGAGYGLGSNTFYLRCRQNDTLRPLFDSGQYDWDFVNRLIKTYRSVYSKIPGFWRQIEKCFRFPIKYPHETTEYKLDDRVMLKFRMDGSTLVMTLPSGREMFYRHAQVDNKGQIKYLHGKLWGGGVAENIMQAMCRDLIGCWILECEKVGIHIVHHAHDEITACVANEVSELKLSEMIDIMSVGPDWAKGLPLAAEGELSKRYKK